MGKGKSESKKQKVVLLKLHLKPSYHRPPQFHNESNDLSFHFCLIQIKCYFRDSTDSIAWSNEINPFV